MKINQGSNLLWNFIFLLVGNTSFPALIFRKDEIKYGYPRFDFYLKVNRNSKMVEAITTRNRFFKELVSPKYLLGYFVYFCFIVVLIISYFKIAMNVYLGNYSLMLAILSCGINIFITLKLWLFAGEKMCGFRENLSVLEAAYILYLMKTSSNPSSKANKEIAERLSRLSRLSKWIPANYTNFLFIETNFNIIQVYRNISWELQKLAIQWEEEESRERITVLFEELSTMYIEGCYGSVYKTLTGNSLFYEKPKCQQSSNSG